MCDLTVTPTGSILNIEARQGAIEGPCKEEQEKESSNLVAPPVDIPNSHLIHEELTSIIPSTEPLLICGCAPWKCKIISGIAVVIVIAFSWTGSTQFAKSTYSKNFHAPFFVTWYNTCLMVVVYPLFMIPLVCKKTPWRLRTFLRHTASIFGSSGFCLKSLVGYVMKRIIPFCAIWIVTNYFYMQALFKLNPGTVTAIFSVSSCFVYILSLLCLKDKFYLVRVGAICLTISGIVLMGYVEGFGKSTECYKGVIFVLLSALGSAFYQVLFKRVMGESSGSQISLYLTLLGLVNMCLLSPILFLLDYMKWEVITWDRIPWINLSGTAILNAVFNYFVNFGISITFPLFISIGISVGLPVNAVADSLFRGDNFGVLKIVSLLLILAGFLMMLIPSEKLRRFEPCMSNEVKSGRKMTREISKVDN